MYDPDRRTPLKVKIDVARGGFVKRKESGDVDFISPLPCPFNYGHLPGTHAADGDSEDAIVLGKKLRRGKLVDTELRGRIEFIDNGIADPK